MRDTEKATSLTPPSRRLKQYGDRRRVGCRSAIISHQTESAVFKRLMLYLQRITLKNICLFKTNKHELVDPKGPENIIYTMMKYGETLRAASQHLTPPAMTIIKF